MSKYFLFIPFLVQGALIAADEILFHRVRGLPRWERVGHPVDTAFLLVCLGIPLFFEPSTAASIAFVVASILSSLIVTKDELIHASHCRAGEHWLHALLFLIHPVVLMSAYLIWPELSPDRSGEPTLRFLYVGTTAAAGLFFIYQILYWNFIWAHRKSTTTFTTSLGHVGTRQKMIPSHSSEPNQEFEQTGS